MRPYYMTGWLVAFLAFGQPYGSARAENAARVNILAVDTASYPEIAIDFQVVDPTGRKLLKLEDRAIEIVEDGAAVSAIRSLDAQTADAATPVRKASLVAADPAGKAQVDLFASGAAIGIVFDNTTLLNVPQQDSGRDYLAEGRRAIEQFLLQPSKAPSNPELVGLFQPISTPEQHVQPPELEAYTVDRNAIINHLRTAPPRTGTTNLYAAIQQAVVTTAETARRHGREPLVLVVSDGGDDISGDTFASLIVQARSSGVKIVTFGIGTDQALVKQKGGFQLNQLASATGGAYLQRPDDEAAAEAYHAHTPVAADAMYTARYATRLIDDGKPHTFVVNVRLANGVATSQPVTFYARGGDQTVLHALDQVLLREYFLFSVPAALMTSLLIVLFSGGLRWTKSRSISRIATKH